MRRSYLSFTICAILALTAIASGCKNNKQAVLPDVFVTISPAIASVSLGSTQQFTATTSGTADTGVIWEVNGILNGNSTFGTISQTGLYTPPTTVPTPPTVSIAAVAHANNANVANATVTLVSNVSISISPASANLQLSGTQQFTATVTGTPNLTVTWQAPAIGTISSTGLYTAPASSTLLPTTVGITATSQVDTTKSATVNATLHAAITITVSPKPATVQTFGTQQFTATVGGNTNTAVTWKVNGTIGGGPTTGTISQAGLYRAPNSVPTQASSGASIIAPVTVQAVSQADSFFTDSSTVTVIAPNKTAQASPAPLGVSGGNISDAGGTQCSGGTLGSLVSQGGNQFILGTNRVLARSDLGIVGDAIIQPSLLDAAAACNSAGTTTVANLSQFFNLETGAGTKVDAALAQVVPGKVDPAGTILQLGATTSNGQPTPGAPHAGSGVLPAIGQLIAKSGRSTGLTCSTVQAINVTFSVPYQKGFGVGATNFSVLFTNLVQIAGGSFSATGDSGSLIVTQATADPVAVLVASLDTLTLANPVSDVLAAMGNPVFVGSAGAHAVAGCSLPAPQPAAVASQDTFSSETLLQANAVRNIHATELLSDPGIQAIGVNASSDDPGSMAIVLFVTNDAEPGSLPAQIDGMRTRIVKVNAGTARGVLSLGDTASLESSANPASGAPLPDAEIARARGVQSAHVEELMKLEGVQGVGISSSADNSAEAALMIYVIRGAQLAEIPALIEGVRTRIQEAGPFTAIP